jgi:hypothetical protein
MEMASLLAVALAVEVLFLGCVVAAWRLHGGRKRQFEQRFLLAEAEARRLAHNARIADASIAEWAELVVEEVLRDLGLDRSSDAG